jgi:4-hydroxy-3-methylbut-2-enyl diphosphate reductase
MQVILAGPRGFCAGVERAVEIVELALQIHGAPLWVRHEIVHNETVVARLRDKGVRFTDDILDIPPGSPVVFSAHGAAPDAFQAARDRGLDIIDATCPLVTKIHLEVRKYLKRGYGILYIGHHGHVETIGTLGQAPGQLHLVTNTEEAESVADPDTEKLLYLTQTTLSLDETADIVAVLRRRFPRLEDPPTSDICYATQNRQDAVKALARQADTILVLGSATSSNSRSLRTVARAHGANAFLIDGPQDLDDSMLDGAKTIGITAGASAPEDLVSAVVDELRRRGATSVDHLEILKEDMEFRLPPGLLQLAGQQ